MKFEIKILGYNKWMNKDLPTLPSSCKIDKFLFILNSYKDYSKTFNYKLLTIYVIRTVRSSMIRFDFILNHKIIRCIKKNYSSLSILSFMIFILFMFIAIIFFSTGSFYIASATSSLAFFALFASVILTVASFLSSNRLKVKNSIAAS